MYGGAAMSLVVMEIRKYDNCFYIKALYNKNYSLFCLAVQSDKL